MTKFALLVVNYYELLAVTSHLLLSFVSLLL
jgi:hypothetical protein